MARRNLAARVAAARPVRAGSGVGNARPVSAKVGIGGAHRARPGVGVGPARPVAGPGVGGGAPAPAPQPVGVPWDAQAEREFGSGEQTYQDKIAGLSGDWKSRQEWYGLGETNNPYSQASLLAHQHEVDQRAVMNGAGLQLYSGSTVNNHAAADRSFDIGYESLKAAYAAEEARVRREEEQARHAWEAEEGAIREGALERATEAEPPAAPLPPGAGGGGGSGKGASAGKGKKKVAIGKARKA